MATYFQEFPTDIQDKIWSYVLDDYRQEHKTKYSRFYQDLTGVCHIYDYETTVDNIACIENYQEKANTLAAYYQELSDQGRLFISTSSKYNEVYLCYGSNRQSMSAVSYCTKKDFTRRGLNWYEGNNILPIYDASNQDYVLINIWVELADRDEVNIPLYIHRDNLD